MNAEEKRHGADARYAQDPAFRELVLFYEYFHGDTGRGVGAAHQTGWTALAASLLDEVARERMEAEREAGDTVRTRKGAGIRTLHTS